MIFLQTAWLVVVTLLIGRCGWAMQQTYTQTRSADVRWLYKGAAIWSLAITLPHLPLPMLALILIGGPTAFLIGITLHRSHEPADPADHQAHKKVPEGTSH